MHRRLLLPASIAAAIALAAFVSLGSASVNVSQSGWSWGNPTPQGNTLNSIDFVAGRGFAAGAAGTVLRTDDNGASWTGLATGTSADLGRMQVIDKDTVVILAGNGCVLRRSDDGGTTFKKIFIVAEQNCPAPVEAFTFVDKNVGYLLARDGSIFRTSDGGQTFAKKTAIPGTQAGNNTGNVATDLAFTGADTGIVFVAPPNNAPSIAFSTTDGGQSWTPVADVEPGSVKRVYLFDSVNAFAVGPNTLLVTSDSGKTWKAAPAGAGHDITSIRCIDVKTCLMTVAKGDVLLKTTDGGQTVTESTPSSLPIFAVAYASATRVVAVGATGTTVVSDDGGQNYSPASSDIGGKYSRLRNGPGPSMAFALGEKGALAMTTNGGAGWTTLAVPTSTTIKDVSFPDPNTGFALDMKGGLFKTANAGVSWQTLDTGSTVPPSALVAPDANTVVLIGPRGIKRATGSGRFESVGGKEVNKAVLTDVATAPGLMVASTPGGRKMFISTSKGSSWKAVSLPKRKYVGCEGCVDFRSSKVGFVIDTYSRLLKTTNGGKSWTDMVGTGSSQIDSISMGTTTVGFMGISSFGPDTPGHDAYVLRTSDGGKTWRPQAIARGDLRGIVTPNATQGFALIGDDSLFFTATGGDVGTPSGLKLQTKTKSFTTKSLKKAKGKVTVTGTLKGAVGGEQILVSKRDAKGTSWSYKFVTAGANNGSFTTSWKIKGTTYFVAQWAGDSGRRGEGSPALTITVKAPAKAKK